MDATEMDATDLLVIIVASIALFISILLFAILLWSALAKALDHIDHSIKRMDELQATFEDCKDKDE